MFPAAPRFAFPGSPLVVSLHRPARRVGGRGADGAAYFVMSCLRRWPLAWRALDVMPWL